MRIATFNNARDRLIADGHTRPIEEQHTTDSRGLFSSPLFSKDMMRPPLSRLMPLVVMVWCSLSVCVFGGSFLLPIYLEQFVALSREQNYWLMCATSLLEIVCILLVFATGMMESPTVGRRKTMLYFTVVTIVFGLVLTFTWYMGPSVLFAGNVFMRCAGLVPYEIMYVYAAEILPTSHRNTGISLGQGASKVVGCLLPLLLLPLVVHPPRFGGGIDGMHQLFGTSLSQDVLRSGGILQTMRSAHALLRSSRFGLQELALNASSDEDANGAIPLGEEGQPIIEADPLVGQQEADPLAGQQKGVMLVSVPYLILTICCTLAAILLATLPDPTESLCDTVTETDHALETARWSLHSRKLRSCP